MALATYSDLLASVAAWLARADLTATIPDLVALAEADIVSPPDGPLRVRQMEGRVPLTATGQYVTLPTGFLEMRALRITSSAAQDPGTPIEAASLDFIQAKYPSAADTGRPRHYTIVGPEIMLGPAPDMTYTLEADVYSFTPLSVANPVNWLMTQFPNIYLFGALEQAAPFIRADARSATWAQKKQDGIAGLKSSDCFARWPKGTMTARPQGMTP